MPSKILHWERYKACDNCGARAGKPCIDKRERPPYNSLDGPTEKEYACKGRKRNNVTTRRGGTVRYMI